MRDREHYWDSIRAFLMLLGIPYHTALSYRPGQDWIVHSGEGAKAFSFLAEFLHLFRMPAFFVIAGYFAAMLLARRSPDVWLRGRLRRLTVPFLMTVVTLVPIMNMACELSNMPLPQAMASWHHNSVTSAGYWVRHLWFLVVLAYCSAVLALVAWRFPVMRTIMLPRRIDEWIAGRLPLVLLLVAVVIGLWEAAAIEGFYAVGLATNVPQELLRIDEFLTFAPYMLAGCLLARSPATLNQFCRFSPTIVLCALMLAFAGVAWAPDMAPWNGRFVAALAAVAMTQVIVAAARAIADRPSPLVHKLVSASFVMYLVHMPIIVILVALGVGAALPVAAKALVVMVATAVLSYGAWQIVARSPFLSFAFNGDPLVRTRQVMA